MFLFAVIHLKPTVNSMCRKLILMAMLFIHHLHWMIHCYHLYRRRFHCRIHANQKTIRNDSDSPAGIMMNSVITILHLEKILNWRERNPWDICNFLPPNEAPSNNVHAELKMETEVASDINYQHHWNQEGGTLRRADFDT